MIEQITCECGCEWEVELFRQNEDDFEEWGIAASLTRCPMCWNELKVEKSE